MADNNNEIFDYDKYMAGSKKRPPKKKPKKSRKKAEDKPRAEEKSAESSTPAENPAAADEAALSSSDIIDSILKETSDKKSKAKRKAPAAEPVQSAPAWEPPKPAAEAAPTEAAPAPAGDTARARKPRKQPRDEQDDVKVYIPRSERGEKFIRQMSEAFESALDEDVSELEEMSRGVGTAVPTKPRSLHRTAYYTVGVICFVMAIIGFIFTVNFFVGVFQSIADNTRQKTEFEAFIYPIVLVDPAEFETTAALPSEVMITSAIWDIIMYADTEKYSAEFDNLSIPEIDVEQHVAKLFGTGLKVEHKSIESHGFYYNEEQNTYTVPSQPNYSSYRPQVLDMTKVGESYTLYVGYLSPVPDWVKLREDYEEEPVKYMYYVVSKKSSGYTLLSVKEAEEQPVNEAL